MKIFAFTLSMPNVGSWNGRWSGEDNIYVRCRKFTDKQLEESKFTEGNYYYNFGDGWGANINVRIIDGREKLKLERKSKGFCGYEWMIENIVNNGKI